MVKSQTGKGNENRGESFITFKERKFGEGDNHPKKFRDVQKNEHMIVKNEEVRIDMYATGNKKMLNT